MEENKRVLRKRKTEYSAVAGTSRYFKNSQASQCLYAFILSKWSKYLKGPTPTTTVYVHHHHLHQHHHHHQSPPPPLLRLPGTNVETIDDDGDFF